MLKQITWAIFISIFIFYGCHNSFAEDINLDDSTSFIYISDLDDNLRLTRGAYVYTLIKEAVLDSKKYVVYSKDNITFDFTHQASPDDKYCKFLYIVPADDESAVRGLNAPIGKSSEIKTDEDMARAQQMIADVQHLNSAKFLIGILPRDDSIKDIAKRIKVNDMIIVTGIHFKHSKVLHNGKDEPLSRCIADTNVFYLTKLEIE